MLPVLKVTYFFIFDLTLDDFLSEFVNREGSFLQDHYFNQVPQDIFRPQCVDFLLHEFFKFLLWVVLS